MAFTRSPVRSRSGPPTFAHACQREREPRLASQPKVAHRSGEAAKVGFSIAESNFGSRPIEPSQRHRRRELRLTLRQPQLASEFSATASAPAVHAESIGGSFAAQPPCTLHDRSFTFSRIANRRQLTTPVSRRTLPSVWRITTPGDARTLPKRDPGKSTSQSNLPTRNAP
jgi:hypothetical protein